MTSFKTSIQLNVLFAEAPVSSTWLEESELNLHLRSANNGSWRVVATKGPDKRHMHVAVNFEKPEELNLAQVIARLVREHGFGLVATYCD